MKVCYVTKDFKGEAADLIDHANEIIERYQASGYKLTLRQLYYQFVSHDLFPATRRYVYLEEKRKWLRSTGANATTNAEPNYKWLGAVLSDARLAGLIDWDAIEDRTRNLRTLASWGDEAGIIYACASQFRIDVWATQPSRIEVWIEKEALAGVFERACNALAVPFFCCRGYTSASEVWGAAQRFIQYSQAGQSVTVLHFGDHDPSGIDMSRDIEDRLLLFRAAHTFKRVALNMAQIKHYSPPPNPAKETDSRFASYLERFGNKSWELDALEPQVLADLVTKHVRAEIDHDAWKEAHDEQKRGRANLERVAERWNFVMEALDE